MPGPNTAAQRDARRLYAYLKRNGRSSRLLLNHVDGELWWSDGFLLLPADVAMVELLDDFNLTAEPMVCEIGRTVKKVGGEAPDFQGLVALATVTLKKMVAIAPVMLNGSTLLIDDGTYTKELWSADGGRTVTHQFDRSRLDVVGRDGEWRCSPEKIGQQAAARYDEYRLTGLLMPFYTGLNVGPLVPEAVAA